MGDLSEFSLPIRLFLKSYRWRRVDPVPWTPLQKPLRDCRIALVSTAGLSLPEQQPFDDAARGGDFSYREIPAETDPSTLQENHRSGSFDHAGIRQDANLALPLERVRELAATGHLGSVNHRHLSFMGSITAPGRLVQHSAPEASRKLAQDQVDIALLVPV